MILGIGIDLCDTRRLRRALLRPGFKERVFGESEIRDCEARARPERHYAARFAAKEACFKALGSGWGQGVAWRDVLVSSDGRRPPRLTLTGGAGRRARALGATRAHLSLTHEGDYAAAVVVIEGRRRKAAP